MKNSSTFKLISCLFVSCFVTLTAFNSTAQTTLFFEDFQTVTAPALPSGWTSTNSGGGFLFETGDSTAANSGGFWAIDPHGQFAFASDDACNCDMSEVRLILPPQNFSGVTSATLDAEVWLDNVYGSAPFETARIEVSIDNGATWSSVGSDFAPIEDWQSISVDLSAYDGLSNVWVAFRFDDNGNWGRGLAIDDVDIQGISSAVCFFSENFQSVTAPALPAGWTSTNPGGGFLFETGDSTAANSGGFWAIDPHGQFAFASDDACNCDMSEVRLILPSQNFSSYTSVTLKAQVWLDNVYGSDPFETARIEVSTDGGTTWLPVGPDFAPVEAWQAITIDLSAYDGQSNVLISFRFDDNGNWGRGLAVDGLCLEGATDVVCVFSENFDVVTAPALPAGWTSTNPGGGFSFETGDSTATNSGGFWAIVPHGQFAFASDDACNCDMSEVRLILPPQDFSNAMALTLKAQVWLDNVYGSTPFETARIEVSLDNGTTWAPVGSDFPPLEAWQSVSVDLSAYDGLSNVWVAFRYDDNGNWGRGLAVDDLCIEGLTDQTCSVDEGFGTVTAPALPPSWTSVNPNGGFLFETGDSTAANSGGFWAIDPHGQFAFASDDACNCDMSEVRLILPPQDFSALSVVSIRAQVWLDNVYGSAPFETARVEVSTNSGTSWTAVGVDFPPLEAWQNITRDLSPWAGQSNVWVAFRYDDNGNWGRGLAVDNASICSPTMEACSPGGLLGGGGPGFVCGSSEAFNFSTDGSEEIPSEGGFGWNFTPGPGAGGGVATGFSISNSNPDVDWDADLNGILSANALTPLTGTWNVQGFVYADPADIGGSLCGFTTGTFMVTFSPDINSAPSSTGETCGLSDGTATANASGGFGGLSVVWSNGSSGDMITGLSAGTYTFTITDGVGCTAAGSVTVSTTDGPNPVVDAVSDVLCNGASTGNINLSVTGGASPYTFLWSNGATTEDLNGIPAGSYEVTVTDTNACSFVITAIEINEPPPLEFNNIASTTVSCFGASDGAVDVAIAGGTSSYLFMWSNGANTEDLAGVPAGDYFLTVTDGNGCVFESPDPFTVGSPDELVPAAIITNESSSGAMDGAIEFSITGGTIPYSYEWSNGAIISDISDLTTGDYTITVTDGNGCESISTWTIQVVVGIENIQGLRSLTLYPNPSDNRVFIELDLEHAMNVKLDIFTVTGQQLLSFPAEAVFEKQYELFMNNFPEGIYLARCTIDGQIFTKRFTIVR